MDSLSWLQVCGEGQTEDCVRRSSSPSCSWSSSASCSSRSSCAGRATFRRRRWSLMSVAIAINIAVGSLTFALRLPIYLYSIGTVLVGGARRPWAGALTGLLCNLIWSILPVPGGRAAVRSSPRSPPSSA